jgi:hypothetical protein
MAIGEIMFAMFGVLECPDPRRVDAPSKYRLYFGRYRCDRRIAYFLGDTDRSHPHPAATHKTQYFGGARCCLAELHTSKINYLSIGICGVLWGAVALHPPASLTSHSLPLPLEEIVSGLSHASDARSPSSSALALRAKKSPL